MGRFERPPIFLVDDDRRLAGIIEQLLDPHLAFRLLQCGKLDEAARILRTEGPFSGILLDVGLEGGANGLDLLPLIVRLHPNVVRRVLTVSDDRLVRAVAAAFRAPHILKDGCLREPLCAFQHDIVARECLTAQDQVETLLGYAHLKKLDPAETLIGAGAIRGWSRDRIAAALNVSLSTVGHRITELFAKVGFKKTGGWRLQDLAEDILKPLPGEITLPPRASSSRLPDRAQLGGAP